MPAIRPRRQPMAARAAFLPRIAFTGAVAAVVSIASLSSCSLNDVPGFELPTTPLDTTTRQPPRSIQTWLDTNSTTVRSLEFSDDDFSDLEELRAAIGTSRLVMLGEQTAFDGTTLKAKARLVRFLHEEMDFDVLVFESGFYDMQAAWQFIVAGGDPREAARRSVAEPYSEIAELAPLFSYIGEQANGARPLELAGVDPQFTGPVADGFGAQFTTDLEAYLLRYESALLVQPEWQAFRELVHRVATRAFESSTLSAEERAVFDAGLAPLRFETNRLVNVAPPREAGFWVTAVVALEAQVRVLAERPTLDAEQLAGVRDSSMAESLVWLAQAPFAERKLIVWTNARGAMRAPREVLTSTGAFPAQDLTTLGLLARETLGDVIYSLAFLAGSGRYGSDAATSTQPVRTLVAPLPESWDGLFLATGKPFAFLHLRPEPTVENVWIFSPRIARTIDYQQRVARWPLVYDGFFFTATMAPATLVP